MIAVKSLHGVHAGISDDDDATARGKRVPGQTKQKRRNGSIETIRFLLQEALAFSFLVCWEVFPAL
jgi:hypothetical protein